MKVSGKMTLRGQLSITAGSTAKDQLIVDDGRINTGYRIIDFYVWLDAPRTTSTTWNAQLSMSPIILGDNMDASNNAEIAWVWEARGTPGSWKEYILDPDHIIVRDLFITLQGANQDIYNYMIVMEQYTISDDEAIVHIIKEGNQSL